MENTFKEKFKVKVDKESGICTLSIKTTDYTVDIYKVSLADMSSLIADFSNLINTKEGHDGSNEGDNMDPLEM
tara:strand:- start:478 stop:696 length:219 start_codon:yes stop_codon:yes gene_type:complete